MLLSEHGAHNREACMHALMYEKWNHWRKKLKVVVEHEAENTWNAVF
jgi:hypothetical protein